RGGRGGRGKVGGGGGGEGVGHAKGDNLAATDHRQNRSRVEQSQGDLAGGDRNRRRCASAIGHGLHHDPEFALEQLSRQVGRRAASRNGIAQGLGFRGRNKIGNRCDPRLGVGGQDDRAAHFLGNRH